MFAWVKKAVEDERESAMGKLFQGAGLTGGGVAAYEFFEFVKANPAASLSIVKEFGPIFALAVLLTALVNRLIGVLDRFAASSQETADAIRQIAEKDDRQAERMQLLTQYAAQSSEEAAKSMSKLQDDIRLQNSALDRIEKRQEGFQAKLDMLHSGHMPTNEPEGKVLPS